MSPSNHVTQLPTNKSIHTIIFNYYLLSLLLRFICLYTFSAIHFQGQCICPVSFYTLLSRFQLPWPLSGCLNASTLFVVSNNECILYLAHLKPCVRFIPHHPICLPNQVHKEKNVFKIKTILIFVFYSRTHLKFDNKLRNFISQFF